MLKFTFCMIGEEHFLEVHEWSFYCDRDEKSQAKNGHRDAQEGGQLTVEGVVDQFSAYGVVDGQIIEMDQVDAVGESTQRHETVPR